MNVTYSLMPSGVTAVADIVPVTESWPQFVARHTASPKRADLKWDDSRGKYVPGLGARCWSPATFKGSRADKNIVSVSAIVFDFDSSSVADVVAATKWRALAFSTTNNRDGAPHSRLVILLTEPLSQPEAKRCQSWLAEQYAECGLVVDPNACGLSQPFFIVDALPLDPAYVFQWQETEGPVLTLDDVPRTRGRSPGARSKPRVGREASLRNYVLTFEPAVSGRRGHTSLLVACIKLRDKGCTEEEAFLLLWELYNPRCLPPWSEGELRRKVREAFKLGRAPRVDDDDAPADSSDGTWDEWDERAVPDVSETGHWGLDPEHGIPDNVDPLSDLANAYRVALLGRESLRYCSTWGKWVEYTGKVWRADSGAGTRAASTMAADLCKSAEYLLDHCHPDAERFAKAFHAHARRTQSAGKLSAAASVAASISELGIEHSVFDADPFKFNVANGTIDLRTGALAPHSWGDFQLKQSQVPYDADARCPRWLSFLHESCGGDADLVEYLRRLSGYALLGDIVLERIFFFFGDGANGKSVFWKTLAEVWGPYFVKAPSGLLKQRHQEVHPTEIARLCGARLVVANETAKGDAWDEVKCKDLASSDRQSARRMHEDFWDFVPSHKLFVAGNHKPRVKGDDNGIWRRMQLIPFTHTVPDSRQDGKLARHLLAERSGVLAWAVQGCLAFQRDGLPVPACVEAATAEYRRESGGTLRRFLDERCEFSATHRVSRRRLLAAYEAFAREAGDNTHLVGAREFSDVLKRRGVREGKVREGGVPIDAWSGVQLKHTEAPTRCPECGGPVCFHVVCDGVWTWDGRTGSARAA